MDMKIIKEDDESVEIWIDGNFIMSANHDEDGWSGMEMLETTARNIAKQLNLNIVESQS